LGSTGLFLVGEDKAPRYSRFLTWFGLFLTTPASNFYLLPVTFLDTTINQLLGGPGFAGISSNYWSNPWRTGLAIALIFLASAGLSELIAIHSCRIANRLNAWTRYMWLLVLPLFAVVLLVFQFAASVVLLIVRVLIVSIFGTGGS
jgi:hypothetical protein